MAASAPPPPDKLEGGSGPAPPPAPPSTGRKQGKAGESAEKGRGCGGLGPWNLGWNGWGMGEVARSLEVASGEKGQWLGTGVIEHFRFWRTLN